MKMDGRMYMVILALLLNCRARNEANTVEKTKAKEVNNSFFEEVPVV